jgi:CRISPR-associated endonuclease/helicase Cas3
MWQEAVMWAHSTNEQGQWHALVDHLYGTARLARRFAEPFGAGEAAFFAGLAHDAGKASSAWQQGLLRAAARRGRVGIDHKTLGVHLAGARQAGVLQLALHGHHGGLTNQDTVRSDLRDQNDAEGRRRRVDAEAALRSLVPELFDAAPVPLPVGFTSLLEQEFLIRFLFSCLVDADALDTQAHRLGLAAPRVGPAVDMGELWERFETRRKAWLSGRPSSPVDRWRDEVYAASVAAAAGPAGLYRLPAPTGSGKTLAAAAFALAHAVVHGKARVIVAVPFITITEQNAKQYRRLLDPQDEPGSPVVLEHHSSVDLDDSTSLGQRWQRLAAENWDAPFVVTTTVQLFESLFGRKPSRMRRVHRLANAVVVLDEVQALPHELLPPITDGLRILSERFGTTVLLASATQPELWALGPLREVLAREVIVDPAPLYRQLRRARYQWWTDPKPTLAQVARRAAKDPQALVVVNTVRDARTTFELLRSLAGRQVAVRHLSTAMCAQHRRDVLEEVRRLLAAGSPVLLVSTQLIEAGVDVDFPVVYRALAPADSLQQAAGRANREGRLGRDGGLVVVFDPADGGAPPAYGTQVGVTGELFGPGSADPDDPETLARYYRALYQALAVERRGSRGSTIQRNRAQGDFLAVADGPLRDAGRSAGRDCRLAFRMIDDDTVPVVVAYQPVNPADAGRVAVADLLGRLRRATAPDVEVLRALQPFIASLRRITRDRPDVAEQCRAVLGDLVEWVGGYDDAGLVLAPTGEEPIP